MHGRRFPWPAVSALIALVCFVGCGQARTTAPTPTPTGTLATVTVAPQVPSLHVLRTSAFPENHIPPFEATVTNAAKIRRLYAAIQALPAYPTKTIYCPVDFGVFYYLTFQLTASQVVHVNVDAGGCQGVSFDGARYLPQKWTALSSQFWQLFADTLGVPVSTFNVFPQPSGPSAPTPVPQSHR